VSRVLVCGGRHYADADRVNTVLRMDCWPSVIITGGAKGADALAIAWADANAVDTETYLADWNLGRHAGPMRNQRMLDEGKPDLVIAFPGGRGTLDMVCRAIAAGITVRSG
jgi:predicted Rossmann-fold nucleotide-binding protein